MHLKSKFTVNSKTLNNNKDNISIPTTEVKTLYGDTRTFRHDMDKLIEYGFIRQVVSGVPTMNASIYGFIDNWKYYNTDKFYIPDTYKRYTRKAKKSL